MSDAEPGDAERVREWRIVPKVPHPDPNTDEMMTCAPALSDGFTQRRARELAHGRNRAGEPSPYVRWQAEPTGRVVERSALQDSV